MKYIKFEVNNREIVFVCEARDTRSGFAHDATLIVDGNQWGKASCFYLNRTWESWSFQSACQQACYEKIDRLAGWIKDAYKDEHGLTRVCGSRKDEVKALIDSDPDIILLREVLNVLRSRCF